MLFFVVFKKIQIRQTKNQSSNNKKNQNPRQIYENFEKTLTLSRSGAFDCHLTPLFLSLRH